MATLVRELDSVEVTTKDALTLRLHRFSVADYQKMIAVGVLSEDAPIELLEGMIVRKMPKNPPHSFCTQYLRDLLPRLLPTGWIISDQEPLMTAYSAPEPDLIVLRGKRADYAVRHPVPSDVGIVVEISDSTLSTDRGIKLRIYATANIPTYWIVNLVDRQVEVYRAPNQEAGTYAESTYYTVEMRVPVVLDGHLYSALSVAEMLPRLDEA